MLAAITQDTRMSVGLGLSTMALAFWVGTIAAKQLEHEEDIRELQKDRDEDRKAQSQRLDVMGQDLARIGAKLDLLLLLEPRDQQKARSRP